MTGTLQQETDAQLLVNKSQGILAQVTLLSVLNNQSVEILNFKQVNNAMTEMLQLETDVQTLVKQNQDIFVLVILPLAQFNAGMGSS